MLIRHVGTELAYRMTRSPFRDECNYYIHLKAIILATIRLVMLCLFMVYKNVRDKLKLTAILRDFVWV